MVKYKTDGRKKIKSNPSKEYIDFICDIYGGVYDDRLEDSKPKGKNWRPGECSNHISLERFRKLLKKSYDISLSTAKIRKILITGGCWSTERSREIQNYYTEFKSIPVVADKLGFSSALVAMYLPYEKVVYDLKDKSGNAKRVERWRSKRKISHCENGTL